MAAAWWLMLWQCMEIGGERQKKQYRRGSPWPHVLLACRVSLRNHSALQWHHCSTCHATAMKAHGNAMEMSITVSHWEHTPDISCNNSLR